MNWETSPSTVKKFIVEIKNEIRNITDCNFAGFYLHGSLAMGGFNPERSDIDILVVTNHPVSMETKRRLAQFFITHSNSPFPLEVSFLSKDQLKDWQHPCPYDFHYSEFWREQYQRDLLHGTYTFLNDERNTDPDLAAHITIMNHRGICVEGEPIAGIFPAVPHADYLSSIVGDFEDCLQNVEKDPVYCCLNLLRVYCYVKEGEISSKLEAGEWGTKTMPEDYRPTVRKVTNMYKGKESDGPLQKEQLLYLRDYVEEKVRGHL